MKLAKTPKAVAFEEATAELMRLVLPEAYPALHVSGGAISRTVLGGSHSVAIYPPIDSLAGIEARDVLDTTLALFFSRVVRSATRGEVGDPI